MSSLSIDPDIEAAWNEEIHRRFDELKAGRAEFIDGDEFDRELAEYLRGSQ